MSRSSTGKRSGNRSAGQAGGRHHGRTTDAAPPSDDTYVRQRSTTVTVVAWTIVVGMSLAVILPVLTLLFG